MWCVFPRFGAYVCACLVVHACVCTCELVFLHLNEDLSFARVCQGASWLEKQTWTSLHLDWLGLEPPTAPHEMPSMTDSSPAALPLGPHRWWLTSLSASPLVPTLLVPVCLSHPRNTSFVQPLLYCLALSTSMSVCVSLGSLHCWFRFAYLPYHIFSLRTVVTSLPASLHGIFLSFAVGHATANPRASLPPVSVCC